jgi:hypothetical protein
MNKDIYTQKVEDFHKENHFTKYKMIPLINTKNKYNKLSLNVNH